MLRFFSGAQHCGKTLQAASIQPRRTVACTEQSSRKLAKSSRTASVVSAGGSTKAMPPLAFTCFCEGRTDYRKRPRGCGSAACACRDRAPTRGVTCARAAPRRGRRPVRARVGERRVRRLRQAARNRRGDEHAAVGVLARRQGCGRGDDAIIGHVGRPRNDARTARGASTPTTMVIGRPFETAAVLNSLPAVIRFRTALVATLQPNRTHVREIRSVRRTRRHR